MYKHEHEHNRGPGSAAAMVSRLRSSAGPSTTSAGVGRSARFTGAGSWRKTPSTAFTTSTTIVTSGLKTCAKGSPATMASVSIDPWRSFFCPSKVLSICSRKRAAVPPAFSN